MFLVSSILLLARRLSWQLPRFIVFSNTFVFFRRIECQKNMSVALSSVTDVMCQLRMLQFPGIVGEKNKPKQHEG